MNLNLGIKYQRREHEFRFPFRLWYRFCERLGLIETPTFVLRKGKDCPECRYSNGYHAMECQSKWE